MDDQKREQEKTQEQDAKEPVQELSADDLKNVAGGTAGRKGSAKD